MTRIFFAAACAVLLAAPAAAKVYTVPAVRMPVVFRVAVAPVAPTLNVVVPTAPVAPSLAAILAARGFNLLAMPRR